MRDEIFTWLGYLVVILVSGTLLLASGAWFLEKLKDWRDSLVWDAKRLAKRDVGLEIMSYRHWFSEDVPTMNLLKNIGEKFNQLESFPVDSLRDDWRKDRNGIQG